MLSNYFGHDQRNLNRVNKKWVSAFSETFPDQVLTLISECLNADVRFHVFDPARALKMSSSGELIVLPGSHMTTSIDSTKEHTCKELARLPELILSLGVRNIPRHISEKLIVVRDGLQNGN